MADSPNVAAVPAVPSSNSCAMAKGSPIITTPIFRRKSEAEMVLPIGRSTATAVGVFNHVLTADRSEVLLMWPQKPDGVAALHALAAVNFLGECDQRSLATLFFPWNRNTAGSQRTLLVDRNCVYRTTLPALNRVSQERFSRPASGYLLALHSVKHLLSSGKKNKRLLKALETDPGVGHPTLFEIMPQHGVQKDGLHRYDDQFLRRLRRHTWIGDCKSHIEAASDPTRTPFFLFGVDVDALDVDLFRLLGVDPQRRGRKPDILLVDMTARARNSIENNDWRKALSLLFRIVHDLYGNEAPPVLAVTDDVFVLQALRWELVKEYDTKRGRDSAPKCEAVLNPKSDLLFQETFVQGPVPEIAAEVYGTDILRVVDAGMKLRRTLADAGDKEVADAVTAAVGVIQNLIGLPGQPRQFHQFLTDNSEGSERMRLGARFDHQTPRSKITSVLNAGLAGTNHDDLSRFLKTFDELCSVADVDNPGRKRFDDCINNLLRQPGRSIIAFSGQVQRGFAEWRIENDPALSDACANVGQKLVLVDRKEVIDELDRSVNEQDRFQRIVFVEPRAGDLLRVVTGSRVPEQVIVLANLARTEQTLRRIKILLALDGIDPIRDKLTAVQKEFQRAMGGHSIDIADLEGEMPAPRFGTLDLTGTGTPGAGALRNVRASGNLQIRAFDGTEVALYDPDALQVFSRKLAKDLRPGDQICVFSPEFVGMARAKLNLTANASEVLALYHKAVAEAVKKLPGGDISSKTSALRERMREIDPTLALPSLAGMKYWIEVADLIGKPRNSVRPQAPRDPKHFLCFMKALGISDSVARHYWDYGIVWTRSMRISTGAAFHQVFMSILIDPYGTISRLSEKHRREIWQIYDAAQEHIVTVQSNEHGGAE